MDEFVKNYRNVMLSYSDIEKYVNIFNNSFIRSDFDILESYVFSFDKPYDFAVTTTFSPAVDLNGKQINNIYSQDKERLKSVFLILFLTNDVSYMILSCLKEDCEFLELYFNQIKGLAENDLKKFLNNVIPTFSENIVLSQGCGIDGLPSQEGNLKKLLWGRLVSLINYACTKYIL